MTDSSSRTPLRDDDLSGKVAIITGGASGIGQALAVAYARAGARSVVGYYPEDPHDVGVTVDLVERAGGQCTAVSVDVRDSQQVELFTQAAVDAYGRLDIAVANAGIVRRASLADMDDETWDDMLAVDLTGVVRTLRHASARMGGPGAMSPSRPSPVACTGGRSTPTTPPPRRDCSGCADPSRWSSLPARSA